MNSPQPEASRAHVSDLRHCFGLICREPQPPEAFATPRSRVCIRCTKERNRRATLAGYHRRAQDPAYRADVAARRRRKYAADAALREWSRARARAYRAINREEIKAILRAETRRCSSPWAADTGKPCRRKTKHPSGRCVYHPLPASANEGLTKPAA